MRKAAEPEEIDDEIDGPWKEALSYFLRDFLGLCFSELHDAIDWSRPPEYMDKEFQKIAHDRPKGLRQADVLVKVWLKTGTPLQILIHVEVQGQPDADFPKRLSVYNSRSSDKYQMDVITLAVLADDRPSWRPAKYEFERFGFKKLMEFPTVKLLDFSEPAKRQMLEESPNPFAILILAHLDCQATKGRFPSRRELKVKLVEKLNERKLPLELGQKLFRILDWAMRLSRDQEEIFLQQLRILEEQYHMPFVDCITQAATVETLRQTTLETLRERFKAIPPELVLGVESLDDSNALRSLFTCSIQAKNIAEFSRMLNRLSKK